MRSILNSPRFYSILGIAAYLSIAAHPTTARVAATSPRPVASPFGVADGYCGLGGSCMPKEGWTCNVGGDNVDDKCRAVSVGGQYVCG